ncbi:hypothetical protein [Paludisphaera rhizosphaerae]|uniref:hypothetical protein n=1 Tax=Paludisphaera rhizosphaerae TaxID=2711216 RepID=UPI0013EB466B|nr:hypothetical protein [Paludisphaera rhizosphaerae]
MDRDNRWNISLADLAVLMVGFALSIAVLRSASDVTPTQGVLYYHYSNYTAITALSSIPLTLTLAAIAIARTGLREWPFHPAIVLGLVTFALAAVLIVPVSRSNMYLFNVGGFDGDTRYVMYGASLVKYVPKFLAATCLVLLACGGLRRRTDWLRAAGWFLSLWWVGLGSAAYVLSYF